MKGAFQAGSMPRRPAPGKSVTSYIIRRRTRLNKFVKNVALYVLLIVIGVSMFQTFIKPSDPYTEFTYSDFMSQVQNEKVDSVTMTNDAIVGVLKDGTKFATYAPKNDTELLPALMDKKVNIKAQPPEQPSWWMSLLSSLLPILILVGVWFWIMNQTQGGGGRVMSFGKSRAKMTGEGQVHVTFADVAGEDEAKEELAEVVDFLRSPSKYTAIGAKIPKGVLLVGPPGTGKTLLAKAVAGEAKVPFFSISGSDFVEMFVGVGASRVRDLFAQAKKNAPCIVFIDEIDAVGRQRGSGLGGGHDEREQTLNQLLVEMDGFGANEGIITLAATNRPDILDPALLRPGRFDRRVIVGRPDLRGRIAILKVHAKNKPLEPDVDLDIIAKKVPGFTGADLANLLNEAALLAAREKRTAISMKDLEEASEKVSYGPERRSHKVSDDERKLTAYHESGHAIMATVLPAADPVHKVTIIPRGQAGGYTMMLPHEERSFITKSHLLAQLRVALGGRCAEQIIFNEISSGASGDLQQVTGILRKMIMEWGMSDRLGPMIFGEHQEQIFLGKQLGSERNYGETVATIIDEEMHKYLNEAYEDTMRTLNENIEVLHAMAKALLEVETIDHKQVENLFKYHSIYAPGEEPVKAEEPQPESALAEIEAEDAAEKKDPPQA